MEETNVKLPTGWEFIEANRLDLERSEQNSELHGLVVLALGGCLWQSLLVKWDRLGDDDADHIAEKAIERICMKLSQFVDNGKGTFRSWCVTILRNTAKNWFRDQSRKNPDGVRQLIISPESWSQREWIGRRADSIPREDEAILMLQHLDDDTKQILQMHSVEGLSFRQIGESLGIKEDTVRQRFFRKRKEIEAFLSISETIHGSTDSVTNSCS